jgi:hypothetical protein
MTKAAKEKRLNELYFDCYSEEQAVEAFIYLTNKDRIGGKTTVNNIRNAYRRRELGTLLRRLDPIAFNVE